MAKVKFVGLQDLDFVGREGDTIQGLKLYLTFQDENVMGLRAESKFINRQSCANFGFTVDSLSPLIGKDVELETNLKGHITGVKPIE